MRGCGTGMLRRNKNPPPNPPTQAALAAGRPLRGAGRPPGPGKVYRARPAGDRGAGGGDGGDRCGPGPASPRPPPACSVGTDTAPLVCPPTTGTAPPHRTPGSSAPAPSGGGGGGVPPSPALSREAGARCRCPPTAPLPAHQPPAAAATAELRSAPRCARPRPPPPPPGEWQTGPRVGRGAAAAPPLPASRPAPSGHGVGSSPGGGRAGTPPRSPRPRVSPLCTKHSHPLQGHTQPAAIPHPHPRQRPRRHAPSQGHPPWVPTPSGGCRHPHTHHGVLHTPTHTPCRDAVSARAPHAPAPRHQA